jgi:hypothetical protein
MRRDFGRAHERRSLRDCDSRFAGAMKHSFRIREELRALTPSSNGTLDGKKS